VRNHGGLQKSYTLFSTASVLGPAVVHPPRWKRVALTRVGNSGNGFLSARLVGVKCVLKYLSRYFAAKILCFFCFNAYTRSMIIECMKKYLHTHGRISVNRALNYIFLG